MADKEEIARKTISLPADVAAKAERNAAKRGFSSSFSAYVAWLIKRDEEGAVERERLGENPPKE